MWRLCALAYGERFTYRSLYAECHAGFWLSVAHHCVHDACLRSGAACDLCCGRRWRGAGGEEIDGTSRCLFMVATDPVTLGPMRNWPPDRGGVGGGLHCEMTSCAGGVRKALSQCLARAWQRRNSGRRTRVNVTVLRTLCRKLNEGRRQA